MYIAEQQIRLSLLLMRMAHLTTAMYRNEAAPVARKHALAPSISALKADLEQGASRVGYVQGDMGAYTPAPLPTGLDQ